MFIIRNIFFILFNNVIKVSLHYKFEWGKVFIPKLSEIFRKVNVFNILFLSYCFIGAQFFTYPILEDDNLNKVRFLV